MTSRSNRYFSVAALAASLLAGWLVWSDAQTGLAPEAQNVPALPVLAADPSRVAQGEVTAKDYRLVLSKQGDGWVAKDRGDYPVRSEVANSLVSSVAMLTVLERKTRNPANHAALGLSTAAYGETSALLRFSLTNGSAGELLAGKRSAALSYDPVGATFVRRPVDDQVWLAHGSAALPPDLPGWFDEIPHTPATGVQRVTIHENGAPVFDAIKREGLYRTAPEWRNAPDFINDALVKRMAAAIVSGSFEDVRPASAVTSESPRRQIVFETEDRRIVVKVLAPATGDWYGLSRSPANSGSKPVEGPAKLWAYRMPRHRIEAFGLSIVDLTTPTSPRAMNAGSLQDAIQLPMPPSGGD